MSKKSPKYEEALSKSEDLIKLYKSGKSICQISKETLVCRSYIAKVLDLFGVKKIETRDSIVKRQQAVINEFTPKIIDWYKNGMAIQKIHDAIKKEGYTIGYETISTILKNNNIHINTPDEFNKKYTCNENIFSTFTKESCYWAGLLAADGCIYQRKDTDSKYIILCLTDKELVENFNKFIEYTRPVTYIQKPVGFGKDKTYVTNTWEVRCLSNKICSDLESNFNITSNKTYTFTPSSKIPQNLIKYFILGFIDGDGSISYYTTNTGRKQFNLSITGTLEIVHYVMKYWNKENLKILQRYPERNVNNYTLSVSGNDQLLVFLNELYSDIDINKICLQRKYNKYLLLKEQQENKYKKASA